MGAAARRRVVADFDYQHLADRLRDAIDETTQEHS